MTLSVWQAPGCLKPGTGIGAGAAQGNPEGGKASLIRFAGRSSAGTIA